VRRLDHVVLEIGPEPVLRPEQRDQVDLRVVGQDLRRMAEATVD
jgi:hypothetical protein